jgi:hypothetical protein
VPFVLPVHVRPRYARCQWKADIPDMLTTVPHVWILDVMERRVMVVSRADKENNELQMYGLTWFSISLLLRQGGSASYGLPADGGC